MTFATLSGYQATNPFTGAPDAFGAAQPLAADYGVPSAWPVVAPAGQATTERWVRNLSTGAVTMLGGDQALPAGYEFTTRPTTLTPAQQQAAVNAERERIALGTLAGLLGETGRTIVGIYAADSARGIAELNNATALRIAELQSQAAAAGNNPAAQQLLQQQIAQLTQANFALQTAQASASNNTNLYIGLAAAGAVVVLGGAYLLTRPRKNPSDCGCARTNPVVARRTKSGKTKREYVKPNSKRGRARRRTRR